MDNQLVKLFMSICLAHLCLSASISIVPSMTPGCSPGSSRVKDCMSYNCDENKQWQEFEFTRTHECCLKTYHPACSELGITYTEFRATTTTMRTTTPTTICTDGSSQEQDCRIRLCDSGQWTAFEFNPTKECCLKEFDPMCTVMGFTEFTATTTTLRTTIPTTTCTDGSSQEQNCRSRLCYSGQWTAFEFNPTKECCLKEFDPMCTVMGFTEFRATTTPLTTTTLTTTCADGSSQEQDCMSQLCMKGQWTVFEFTPTKECCLKEFHPMCREMEFSSTEFIPTTTSPTTTSQSPACVPGSSREQDCMILICEHGQWQIFEFTATKECCLKEFHPKCAILGITFTGFSSSATSPTPDCSSSTSRVQDCGVYLCENGKWQLFEFFATKECCSREFHPKCTTLGITLPDESSPKDWPQTDSYFLGRLDILLLRLLLQPDLQFPATYKPVVSTYANKDNGRPLNPPIHKSAPPKNSN